MLFAELRESLSFKTVMKSYEAFFNVLSQGTSEEVIKNNNKILNKINNIYDKECELLNDFNKTIRQELLLKKIGKLKFISFFKEVLLQTNNYVNKNNFNLTEYSKIENKIKNEGFEGQGYSDIFSGCFINLQFHMADLLLLKKNSNNNFDLIDEKYFKKLFENRESFFEKNKKNILTDKIDLLEEELCSLLVNLCLIKDDLELKKRLKSTIKSLTQEERKTNRFCNPNWWYVSNLPIELKNLLDFK